ncbi:class I SAM-dependent methyltransferase [Pelomonas sp. CA6]|uniref:class I SAM-dependent methyltransferase n=1 Tax=Pelomonas sp. CA6 TaxID=2907999 RepID=UPI001F4C4369|nr:class I SAM-dependent methyltransferase [Pelomonas sp. CA6]MCH7343813.1 class I SAM-dependent methyltransferase [Pelomonas sp. CA6]
MNTARDARFWNRSARKYAKGAIADPGGYERTLDRTRALLGPSDQVLELGCGTGTSALRLASEVQSYLATDISAAMIEIAHERHAASPVPGLVFRATTVEDTALEAGRFNAVLGFNYLHLVRDLPGTLRRIHSLLAPEGLLITKTPCVGDMHPLIRWALLPAMHVIGMAPYAGVFREADLGRQFSAAGFVILASEHHATKGRDHRPYIVARKRSGQRVRL